jgi:hypothetical protein|tara:strand:- start:172 stop:357 length:186 start_codon:yes stop_codon:yes gene_type:complete
MSKKNKLKNGSINSKELGEVLNMIDRSRKKLSTNLRSSPAVILDLICAANKLNTFIRTSKK